MTHRRKRNLEIIAAIVVGVLFMFVPIIYENTRENEHKPGESPHADSASVKNEKQDSGQNRCCNHHPGLLLTDSGKKAIAPAKEIRKPGKENAGLQAENKKSIKKKKREKGFLLFLELVSHLGLGLVIIGVLPLILEQKHWTAYFEERLKKIVVEQDYLNSLNDEELARFQQRVIRAFYHNKNLKVQDTFLQYYENNVKKYIAQPFRENYVSVLTISKKDGDLLLVEQEITWNCKAAHDGQIQEDVGWESKEEWLTVLDLTLVIGEGSSSVTHDHEFLKNTSLTKAKNLAGKGFIYAFNTDELKIDGLKITVQAKFQIPLGGIIPIPMSYPTNGLTINVNYDQSLKLTKAHFFGEAFDGPDHNEQTDTSYAFKCPGWVMPGQGLLIQLFNA